jgi:hypothetical protein
MATIVKTEDIRGTEIQEMACEESIEQVILLAETGEGDQRITVYDYSDGILVANTNGGAVWREVDPNGFADLCREAGIYLSANDDFGALDFAMTEPRAERPREEAVRSRIVGAEREGDFDKANELDAELDTMCDEIADDGELSPVCLRCDDFDTDAAECKHNVPEDCTRKEEHATRAYLEAMVAAGYELQLVDRTPITVDQAIEHLADAGRRRVGATVNVVKVGGSAYTNINGWL